jgi:hypothetical protein
MAFRRSGVRTPSAPPVFAWSAAQSEDCRAGVQRRRAASPHHIQATTRQASFAWSAAAFAFGLRRARAQSEDCRAGVQRRRAASPHHIQATTRQASFAWSAAAFAFGLRRARAQSGDCRAGVQRRRAASTPAIRSKPNLNRPRRRPRTCLPFRVPFHWGSLPTTRRPASCFPRNTPRTQPKPAGCRRRIAL